MGKIIFSVSYEIDPEKRDEYLELMKKVREQIREVTGQDYTVYEDSRRPNLMSEVYYLDNDADFRKVQEMQEEKPFDLIDQIDNYLLNQDQVVIRTFREIL